MKKFFTWLLAFPTIVCIVLLGCYCFKLNGQTEWITLITAWISSTATIMLGVIVFYQTENHKKRQEEDNALYQEQADKSRQQDLMLRANPHAVFNKIECIRYAHSALVLSKNSTYNRLTNIDFEGFHNFDEHVYLDLNFIVPQNNVLERVYIKSVQINCYKGEFAGGDFEEIASYSLKNYSSDENLSNVKINKNGGVDSLLSLAFDLSHDEMTIQSDIKNLLDNSELKWVMTIYYTLSNSFKIAIDYKTHLNFGLAKEHIDEFGDSVYSLVKASSTTIQISNITIKEKD